MKKIIFLILIGIAGFYLYKRIAGVKNKSVHFETKNPQRFYNESGARDFFKLKRKRIKKGERFYTFKMRYPWVISININENDVRRVQTILQNMARLPLSRFGLRRDDPQLGVKVWHIIYSKVYASSKSFIRRLARIFYKIKKAHKLDDLQTAYMALRFIQFMHYKRPGGQFDYYTPARSLFDLGKGGDNVPHTKNSDGWHGAGDCDTKTIVLMLILNELGYKSVMFHSLRYKHAMIGISVPGADGDNLEINGIKYYFTETTYKNWRIGQLPYKYSDKDYWVPMMFENTKPGKIIDIPNRDHGKRKKQQETRYRENENRNRENANSLDGGLGD